MQLHCDQKGSGFLVGLLILVIVGIVGFTGWFVWHTQNRATDNPDVSRAVTSELPDTSTYVTVDEWGVKFTIPASLKHTTIRYERLQTSGADMIGFMTTDMEALGCTLGEYGSDAVWRDTVSHNGEIDTIPLNDDNPINGYYYYVVGARSSCTSDTETSAIETAQREALQAMFKTIQKDTSGKADYLVLKEWGMKLMVSNADKYTYSYSSEGGQDMLRDISSFDSSVMLQIKTEYLDDVSCADVGVGYVRSKVLPSTTSSTSYGQVGEYYFYAVGGPGACGSESDQKLQGGIIGATANELVAI